MKAKTLLQRITTVLEGESANAAYDALSSTLLNLEN